MKGKAIVNLLGSLAKQHGSTALTIFAALGVVAVGVLAAKARPEADDRLQRAKEDKATAKAEETGEMPDFNGTELTFVEKIKAALPAYVKVVIVAGVTVALIVGSHVISMRQIGDLAAGYSVATAINDRYEKYAAAAKEVVGEEKEKEIRENAHKAYHDEKAEEVQSFYTVNSRDICKSAYNTGNGSQLFYDPYSNTLFYSSREAIKDSFNRLVMNRANIITMHDVYDALDLPIPSIWSDNFGWDMNNIRGALEVEFRGSYDLSDEGFSYIVLDYWIEPTILGKHVEFW